MLIILSLLGFIVIIALYNVINHWVKNRNIKYDFLISSVLLIGIFSFFINVYIEQKEVDNNLNAVYNYFGKNNVDSISINQDGEITQAEVNNKAIEIKVSDGEVVELKK